MTVPSSFGTISVDLLITLVAQASVFFADVLRGGKEHPSLIGLTTCEATSWGILLCAQIVCQLCSFFSRERHKDRLIGKTSDPEYNKRSNNLFFPLYLCFTKIVENDLDRMVLSCLGGGCLTGLIGIGGASLTNIILLNFGFSPMAVAGIAATTLVFSMTSMMSQFVVLGAVNVDHVCILVAFSIIGSLIGNLTLLKIVDKYKKPSIMIWLLFGLQITALLILPTLGIIKVVNQGRILMFSKPC